MEEETSKETGGQEQGLNVVSDSVRAEVIKHISARDYHSPEVSEHPPIPNGIRHPSRTLLRLGLARLCSKNECTHDAERFMVEGPPGFFGRMLPGLWCLRCMLRWHGTDQCDAWRETLLSVANGASLKGISLKFVHHHFLAYLPGFILALGAFIGMTMFLLSIPQATNP